MFQEVPKKYYIEAILFDIASAKEEILDQSIYYTLNSCRVLYFFKEEKINSKKEGGQWALSHLPIQYQDIVQAALSAYCDGLQTFIIPSERLLSFADYMLKKIAAYHPLPKA